ncbi:formate dehydrogenase subunit delta [Trinickia sp. LjRoot230]|uniref:formate dehydrogenase subunit delta n=1 Tax=Trinickia sp. LjRoot230 TaxID=3342288 RepID=UPI003ED04A2B
MNEHHLIEMANRIGEFFESMPDRNEAMAGIADHIHRFWEPRMRRAILAALDNNTDACASMLPIVKDALIQARAQLAPAQAA